jgi:hypothetical protein
METKEIISWLLEGDVSIQYQVHRDLLGAERSDLQERIASEGWGLRFLECQHADGHWGRKFYQPKWTSTHYTLLDLKHLNIEPTASISNAIQWVLENEKGPDGGINPSKTLGQSDVCINGMVLNYACYFQADEAHLASVVDFLLSEKMADGGFNCQSNRKGATHSSLHTTLSVLEGILEYERNGYTYRLDELRRAQVNSQAFILLHHLFLSDRTGAVINPAFLRLHYPCRWYYDILRALDYFRLAQIQYDPRMEEALQVILAKRTRAGLWKLAGHYAGATHFDMEQAGKPSRWNTLRAMRVLGWFDER